VVTNVSTNRTAAGHAMIVQLLYSLLLRVHPPGRATVCASFLRIGGLMDGQLK